MNNRVQPVDDEPVAGACDCDSRSPIGAHFDAKIRRGPANASAPLHFTTRGLLELLPSPAGRTVLEVGCGRGGLLAELLRSGAAAASGVDLSGASIEVAKSRLTDEDLADRASLTVGDGAELELDVHDWVVLDRVICCYPDADALLANSSRAAGSIFAFSVPDSRGWRGAAARASRWLDNTWNALQRRRCSTFVHDLGRIDRALTVAGLRRRARARHGLWYVAVYERV